jgi:serine/threonine protein kinase
LPCACGYPFAAAGYLTCQTLGHIFDALEYLHAIGYIHGDLEPKHMHLTKDGTTGHIIDLR